MRLQDFKASVESLHVVKDDLFKRIKELDTSNKRALDKLEVALKLIHLLTS